MNKRRGSIGSARATRRRTSKRVGVNVDDEPESQQLGLSFNDLPSEIVTHILLRLPVESIPICKCVCKSWKALISDPHFAESHFQHTPAGFMIRATDRKLSRFMYFIECEPQKFENDDGQFCGCECSVIKPECNYHFELRKKFKLPFHGAELVTRKRGRPRGCNFNFEQGDDKLDVVNSCNGLVCLYDLGRESFVVWNPITREFIRLPEASRIDKCLTNEPAIQSEFVGFGFHPKTNEYKVVRVLRCLPLQNSSKGITFVEMHTLGESSWRMFIVDSTFFSSLQCPTCVNGALHWIDSYRKNVTIFCFDFESEKFQTFPTPPDLFINYTESITMGELGGSLYICDSSPMDMDTPFKMWIMKKYNFRESWTRVFNIDTMSRFRWPYGGLYWPIKYFKNGDAILMYHSLNFFIYYEPKKNGFKFFKVCGTLSTFEVIPHIPSPISLKDAVKGNNIEVLNVQSRCEELKLQKENEVLFLAKVNDEVGNLCIISSDDEEETPDQ